MSSNLCLGISRTGTFIEIWKDGNQEIDFEEFKVLEDIFSQSAQNSIRKVFY